MNRLGIWLNLLVLFLMGSSVSFAADDFGSTDGHESGSDEVEVKDEQAEDEDDAAYALRTRSEGEGLVHVTDSDVEVIMEDIASISINDLPPEMIDLIAQFLDANHLKNLALANRYISRASENQRRLEVLKEGIPWITQLTYLPNYHECEQALRAIKLGCALDTGDDLMKILCCIHKFCYPHDFMTILMGGLKRVLQSGQASWLVRRGLLEGLMRLAQDQNKDTRGEAAIALGKFLASGQGSGSGLERERLQKALMLLEALMRLDQDEHQETRDEAARALEEVLIVQDYAREQPNRQLLELREGTNLSPCTLATIAASIAAALAGVAAYTM